MPGLRRDVLRWLVALNLSFPIKNMKRDFSNGFMVAEIFSRYFPQDVQMHSYDYGSRLATKKDNWEQLKKFFRKKGFTIVIDEIDNIIQCTSDDGAAPILERMYNFLTQKPKIPENIAEELSCGNQDYSYGLNNQPSDKYISCDEEGENESSRSDNSAYSISNYEGEEFETCRIMQDDETCLYDGLVQLGPDDCGYEFDPKKSVDIEDNGDDLLCSLDSGVRFVTYDEDQQYEIKEQEERVEEQDLTSKKKNVNAVEKARQREYIKAKMIERAGVKAGLSSTEIKQTIAGRKSCFDVALAFRSPNRSRKMNFKQYTLLDYRRQKQFGYVQLGSLGPTDDPELNSKRQALERVKEFGRHARSCNTISHSNATLSSPQTSLKPSSRKMALEFASSIPKPKRKKYYSKENANIVPPIQNPHGLTELQILEMKHESHKEHVEAIRRDLEHFLR